MQKADSLIRDHINIQKKKKEIREPGFQKSQPVKEGLQRVVIAWLGCCWVCNITCS